MYLPCHPDITMDREDLIVHYHFEGLSYPEILRVLAVCHGLHMTYCALRKYIRRLHLPLRRGPLQHTDAEITTAIQNLLPTLPRTTGYRNLHLALRDAGLNVRRHQVMRIYRSLDPDGCADRRRRRLTRRNYYSYGVDFYWHLDGK